MEAAGENPSARVKDALRNDLAARRRHQALTTFLDRLAVDEGALDTPEDEEQIQRFMHLVGGAPG